MTYASERGLYVGDKIKILEIDEVSEFFKVGDILTFIQDDNSNTPWFKGGGYDRKPMHLPKTKWEHYEEEKDMTETKKLKFPCCVPTSQIKDEATLNRLIDLFVVSGAIKRDFEYYRLDDWRYIGVSASANNSTQFYDRAGVYSEQEKEGGVTVYSAEELLSPVVAEVPVVQTKPEPELFPVGSEVKIAEGSIYHNSGEDYNPINTKGTLLRNASPYGDDFHYHVKWDNGHRNSYKLDDLVLWEETPSTASQEEITDVSNSKPSVGIDSSDSGYKEPTEPLVSIAKEVKYYVTIKGVDFTFTQDEVNELVSELEGFVDYE